MILGDVEETTRVTEINDDSYNEFAKTSKRTLHLIFLRGDTVRALVYIMRFSVAHTLVFIV